jgi:hypothetical protein
MILVSTLAGGPDAIYRSDTDYGRSFMFANLMDRPWQLGGPVDVVFGLRIIFKGARIDARLAWIRLMVAERREASIGSIRENLPAERPSAGGVWR